jgi:excisionase family DNA binding protein
MKLITIKELSTDIKVKTSTLYSWVRNGTIPCYKLNGVLRFDLQKIERWIEDSKITPSGVRTLEKKPSKTQDIDAIVKKAIEEEKPKVYTPSKRETGPKTGSQGRRF